MSKDREKQIIKRRILHFAQQRDYDRAIEECKKYLKIPGVVSREVIEIKKKMADFYERKGDKRNMVREYIALADLYVNEDFAPKAPPLLKKAFQFAERESKREVLEKMAEVYNKMGWRSEVIKCYSTLIEIYAKKKEHYKAKEIYEKIIQLDPGNLENRVKYIEYLLHIGFKEEAKTAMEKLLDKLSEKENKSIILPIYEKMPSLFSTHHLKVVAQAYFAKGEYQKGVNVLKHYFEKGGKRDDPELFEMLYYGFSELGRLDKAMLALKELRKIYKAQKNSLKMRRVYERILSLEPENEEAKAFLDKYTDKEEEEESETVSSIIRPDELSLMLTKLEILVKFDLPGYREKAEELVRNIDVLEIEDEAILKRLLHIFKKLGYTELLSLVYTQIAKVKEKSRLSEEARYYVEEALRVWNENPHAIELKERLIPEEEVVTEVEVEEVEKEVVDGSYDLERALHESEEEEAPEEEVVVPTEVVETQEVEVTPEVTEERIEVELPSEAEGIKVELHDEVKSDVDEVVEEPSSRVDEIVEEPSFTEDKVEVKDREEEIDELMQEMEFFRGIGDQDSVREICQRILKIDPHNEVADSVMKEIEGGEPVVSAEDLEEITKAMEEVGEESAEERVEEDEEEILKELLEEFKKKVDETYSKEDSATHYELGYAYMEMELWDEAIKEFEVALQDENLKPSAYSLLARCYRMKGEGDKAMNYYKELLESSYLDEEGKAVIRKEMGELFEEKRDYAQALNYYKDALKGLSSNHPDKDKIVEKINSLQPLVEGEEEEIAEVKDIMTARKKKKKIHYM